MEKVRSMVYQDLIPDVNLWREVMVASRCGQYSMVDDDDFVYGYQLSNPRQILSAYNNGDNDDEESWKSFIPMAEPIRHLQLAVKTKKAKIIVGIFREIENKRLPGPIPIPIIGNIEAYRADFMKTAEEMQLKYGDFWEIWQGSNRHVWISRADLTTKLLNPSYHNNNYSFRTAENKGLDLMGLMDKGIIYNLNLEGWITNRKFINQIFMSPKFLRRSVQITSELFSEMERYWINLELGIELNLANWMMRFMTDFTFITTTNKKVYAMLNYYNTFPNSKKEEKEEVINNSTTILQESEKMVKAIRTHFMATIFFKDTSKYLRILYPPYRAKSKKLLSEVGWLNEKVKELVEERKKEIEEIYKYNINKSSEKKELKADMLTMMLTLNTSHDTTTKDSEPMSQDEIQEIVYEIIGVKEKMMKEIELMFGKDINRPIIYEELNKSSYCEAIIKEVSRLMTTVSTLFRINSKADEIDGYKFEPSTIFKINVKEIQMNKPDRKEYLLIESGIRIHSTQFSRDKSSTPSAFCSKIRKYIKTRRLTDIKQLGVDRIIDFEFAGSTEENTFHIIAEFYASIAVGQIYDLNIFDRPIEPVTRARLQKVLITKDAKYILKKVLNDSLNYGQSLTEHAIRFAKIDPNIKIGSFDTSEGGKEEGEKEDEPEIYNEFHPFLFEQHKSKNYKEFDSFDLCVDEYYSSMESQKLMMKQRNQEKTAMKKLEAIKKEQYSRVESLQNSQTLNIRKAKLIEENIDIVDQAILVIRNAIASSMDWKDLEILVMDEKRQGNPIAAIIEGLKLEINQITLSLRRLESIDDSFYDSSDSESNESNNSEDKNIIEEKVDVDIYLTAFANAKKYYDSKKQSAIKETKTLASAEKAFKSAEQKIKQDLKETKITASINRIRKPFWFEKFIWFISSENYLVIAGHDMQQNELLVKRHLRKGDAYVHADLHGAASVIIKNSQENQPIPPSTLFQAGIMSVCQSKAWEAKIITSAFWVHADQVSKAAPTGEYLTTGSFMIRGKKNFLPPVQLVYGLGLLFRLDEQSIPNHLNERRAIKFEEDEEEDINRKQMKDSKNSRSTNEETTLEEPTWEKYNLDEYGGDQNEEDLNIVGTSGININVGGDKFSPPFVIPLEKTTKGDKPTKTIQKELNVSGKGQQGKSEKSEKPEKPTKNDPKKSENISDNLLFQYQNELEVENLADGPKNEEAEEIRQLLKEENIKVLENETLENLTVLDSLTGVPLPDDILLFAVPVCAPYIALQKYKYKVKLTPGSMKKGQASKMSINLFIRDPEITPREKELVKSIPDVELASVMVV
ncbi:4905_t:CDS:10 [Diversispora eburnea]|uniref:4905_t:CDS:1 n=1 Tax=Diversispora eburnea TaxID=1213867 RepID=A0A9N8WGB6_9GLOM|nr:4905_t:CDS:10 [Diversispora eburnea]